MRSKRQRALLKLLLGATEPVPRTEIDKLYRQLGQKPPPSVAKCSASLVTNLSVHLPKGTYIERVSGMGPRQIATYKLVGSRKKLRAALDAS